MDFLIKLFESCSFQRKELHWDKLETLTYINDKSETYILAFINGITEKLPDDIMGFCANEVYNTKQLTQAQKSNLSIIVVVRIDTKFLESQRNVIFKLEENDLYYKKFVLWYSEEELDSINKIVDNNFEQGSLYQKLIDKKLFENFKEDQEKSMGYALLSRIYIKLPFLTLNELATLEKTLADYVEGALNELNPKLYKIITCEKGSDNIIDDSIELMELSPTERAKIDKDLKELVKIDE